MAKANAAQRVSPAAMLTRGSLFAYLQPRLAMDQRPHTLKIAERATQGVTSANFRKLTPAMTNALRRSVQGRLAQDGLGIDDLAQLSAQPRTRPRGDRHVHRAIGDLPAPVRDGHPDSRPPEDCPLRCHPAPDRGLAVAPANRSVSVGYVRACRRHYESPS